MLRRLRVLLSPPNFSVSEGVKLTNPGTQFLPHKLSQLTNVRGASLEASEPPEYN
jgi:hypothetical protein